MRGNNSIHPLVTIVALAVIALPCFGQDIDERIAMERLSARIGLEKAASYVERFGRNAEDSFEIEEALMKMLARQHGEVDRSRLDAAVDRVASRDPDHLGTREKRQLARSWFLLYELAKQDSGSGLEGLERLRIAAQLDPDEPSYVKELDFQERRQAQIQARLDEAADLRAGFVWDHGEPQPLEGGAER